MFTYNKLLLNWKEPNQGYNFNVGILEKKKSAYLFYYIKETVNEASKHGFEPLLGFSNLEDVYTSKKLFSTFQRRIPNQKRNDFKMFLMDNNLDWIEDEKEIDWHYLTIHQGRVATDSLFFTVPVVYEDNHMYVHFDIAGWTHYREQNNDLLNKKFFELSIACEENNQYDSFAIKVTNPADNSLVGYVPRPYNKLIFKLLNKGINFILRGVMLNSVDGRPKVITLARVNIEDLPEEVSLQYMIDYHVEEDNID